MGCKKNILRVAENMSKAVRDEDSWTLCGGPGRSPVRLCLQIPTQPWDPQEGAGMGVSAHSKQCQGCPTGPEPDHRHLSDHRDHQTHAQAPLSLLPPLSWAGAWLHPIPSIPAPPWGAHPGHPFPKHPLKHHFRRVQPGRAP